MAIEYILYLADDRRPHEVVDEITHALKTLGGAPDPSSAVPAHALPHLWVAATPIRPPTDEIVAEEHGFTPVVRVHLRLDKENLDPAQRELLEVLSTLLRRSLADAVLVRDEGTVALARKGGHLVIGEDALWSTPDRRGWIHRQARRRGTSIS